MSWYISVLKKYATFSGRARRKEYWMFTLFNTIFCLITMALDNMFGLTFSEEAYGFIYMVYVLAVFLPSWAVLVRRLHDVGKSGWWIAISLIPLLGAILLFIWTVSDSDYGDNKYGANPKGMGSGNSYDEPEIDVI